MPHLAPLQSFYVYFSDVHKKTVLYKCYTFSTFSVCFMPNTFSIIFIIKESVIYMQVHDHTCTLYVVRFSLSFGVEVPASCYTCICVCTGMDRILRSSFQQRWRVYDGRKLSDCQ